MYRKNYYPNYNNLLYRTTVCALTGKECSLPTERPPPGIASNAEAHLTVERWTCALDCVSAMLNDRFLLFLEGPPPESLSSESLCAVSTIPNRE
ncbi:hypothetical protein AYI68_g2405 [Smittium mucronatum]|uniref:Uncharacterized protein n=1 Tax=Smittium mucronatum TaxID=133383 RepID=A0A1R0H2U4_9FUNG|nr:hypothetical protein AYI68_g5161 [Smittium mucronatum]OLY83450.1 hypothetical protein AYI68_g2405 [Smittium mucronatum]